MYYHAISQMTRNLMAVEAWLDKTERHAAGRGLEVDAFMASRLASDMKPFVYQVQSACDYVKAAAAWLSGQAPPKHEDNESKIDEVRARVRKTVAFVESVKESQFASADQQKIHMSWAPPGKVLGGEAYLLQMAIPNVYFHLSMAYAILRHHGVDVGKMDFLGSIDWMDA